MNGLARRAPMARPVHVDAGGVREMLALLAFVAITALNPRPPKPRRIYDDSCGAMYRPRRGKLKGWQRELARG